MGTRKKVNKKMSYTTVSTPEGRKKYTTVRRKKRLRTVGVRFANDPGNLYTYLAPANRENLYLGMELIVEDKYGNSKCCYLVRIDDDVKLPDPAVWDEELKHVKGKVVVL